ncbi:MAG: DUF2071 domain-containing protein, partial [Clostridia bacterium]|nr:DUF2071 domain-containing protein [Clostridia bacterium]
PNPHFRFAVFQVFRAYLPYQFFFSFLRGMAFCGVVAFFLKDAGLTGTLGTTYLHSEKMVGTRGFVLDPAPQRAIV